MGCAINVSLERLQAAHRDSFAFTHTKIRCVYILGALAKLQKATVSFVVSVCLFVRPAVRLSAWDNSAATGRILMKSDI